MKKWAPRVLLAAALAGLSAFLLKGDVWTFWTWWLLAFLMGMVAMPVTGRLFGGFEDCLQDLKIRAGCFLKCWQLRLQDFLHGCL